MRLISFCWYLLVGLSTPYVSIAELFKEMFMKDIEKLKLCRKLRPPSHAMSFKHQEVIRPMTLLYKSARRNNVSKMNHKITLSQNSNTLSTWITSCWLKNSTNITIPFVILLCILSLIMVYEAERRIDLSHKFVD